jgi:tetratricopeptide (TPR) repeat protein
MITTRAYIVRLALILLGTLACGLSVAADDSAFDSRLHDIQARWAVANYEATGSEQKAQFENLLDDARQFAQAHPERAEALAWQGIVASSYAGVKGPFGAMSLAKEARESLTSAEKLDPTVLNGSVYTSLGVLYNKVPGGIIGFGDKDVARQYLEKALAINPDGIDPNYFYGELLFEQKDYDAAREALLKARQAPPRPDRSLADSGRHREIDALLEKVEKKIGSHS